MGVFPIREALRIAYERGLDLVEVAPNAKPVVCRIMDYGRFKYEQSKKDKESRRNQKQIIIKEIKMRTNIEDHDFEVKARRAEDFLRNGNKVKATIMFRGREITHAELGRVLLDRLTERLKDVGVVESKPKVDGRNMVMMLAPKPERVRPEKAQSDKQQQDSQEKESVTKA